MRFSPKRTQSLAVIVACAVSLSAAIVLVVGYNIHRHVAMDSARHLLKKADDLAWNNQWIAAEPLYRQAEQILANQGNSSKALYARISQVPPHVEAGSLPSEIFELTKTLRLPAAQDPDTRLRILEIRGMIESNYGAGLVELRRYKEALTALDEAINTEEAHAEVGYPSIAINSKIDALRGLQRYTEAVALANEALTRVPNPSLRGHYHQLYLSRASVYENLNQWDKATADL